jgi:hypothetical protein
VLIAPVLGEAWGQPPACDVCRVGGACAACFHANGGFLVCPICAKWIATAHIVRIAFVQDATRPDELPVA